MVETVRCSLQQIFSERVRVFVSIPWGIRDARRNTRRARAHPCPCLCANAVSRNRTLTYPHTHVRKLTGARTSTNADMQTVLLTISIFNLVRRFSPLYLPESDLGREEELRDPGNEVGSCFSFRFWTP